MTYSVTITTALGRELVYVVATPQQVATAINTTHLARAVRVVELETKQVWDTAQVLECLESDTLISV